jgi:hypothetical protein
VAHRHLDGGRSLTIPIEAGVIQICWITPEPLISPIVNVDFAGIRTDGEIFQPRPNSRAAFLPVPSVAMAALPFSPVKFSGLIERVLAFDSRGKPAKSMPSPSDCRPPQNDLQLHPGRYTREQLASDNTKSFTERPEILPHRFILLPFP